MKVVFVKLTRGNVCPKTVSCGPACI